jgi:hypothetical protein
MIGSISPPEGNMAERIFLCLFVHNVSLLQMNDNSVLVHSS